jgi:hypothetical protein
VRLRSLSGPFLALPRWLVLALPRWLAVVVGALACFEIGSAYLYYLETGNRLYDAQLRQEQQKAVSVGQGHTLKLHPYYGFISAYSNEPGIRANNYGFTQLASLWQVPGCCDLPIAADER